MTQQTLVPAFTAIAIASLATAQPAYADAGAGRLHLEPIELRLFYRPSGTLSADLLHGDGPRGTWNLAIGGGGLEAPADDALLVLPITAERDAHGDGQVFSDVPITIRARREGGKIIAQRTVKGVLTSSDGRAHLALWLPDVTCAGPLLFEATMARQRVTARFDFRCGE